MHLLRYLKNKISHKKPQIDYGEVDYECYTISHFVTASYDGFKHNKTAEALLADIEKELNSLVDEYREVSNGLKQLDNERWQREKPDLTTLPYEQAVQRIMMACKMKVDIWEEQEPYLAEGLPLLEDTLRLYFSKLG